jgi:hypothetical protein
MTARAAILVAVTTCGQRAPHRSDAGPVRVAGGPCEYKHLTGTCHLVSVTERVASDPAVIDLVASYEVRIAPPDDAYHLPAMTYTLAAYPETRDRVRKHLESHPDVACEEDVLVKGTCGTPGGSVHVPPLPE